MTIHVPAGLLASTKKVGASTQSAFLAELRERFTEYRLVFALTAVYGLAAMAVALSIAGEQRFAPLSYAPTWLRGGLSFGFLYLMLMILPPLLRERPDRPLLALGLRLKEYLTPAFVVGVSLIAVQVLVMGTFTSVKNMLPQLAPYSWDAYFANLDATLHFGADPWRYLEPLIANSWSLHAVESFYFTAWMLALGIVPAIIAFSPRFVPIRLRFFLTYILCWIVIGNVLAGIFMSAGPVYFGDVAGDVARFKPLSDHLVTHSGTFLSAFDIQRSLWFVHERGMSELGSGISAFPSMHIAMATLWVIVGFHAGRRFGVAALTFLAAIETAAVALGWHYAVDGYASIVLAFMIWTAVGGALRVFRPARDTAASSI